MKTIPQFCQNCRAKNTLGEPKCRKCGTRLMLVVFPPSLRYDTNQVPSYYEDHLLERVTSLELRLAQITERLATTLDLMLRQTKTTHTDHLLLETLIESLNTLGAIEKETLAQNWRERVDSETFRETAEKKRDRILNEILSGAEQSNPELFAHLVKEAMRLLSLNEEKQGFGMLERALLLSPENMRLLIFIAENYFLADKSALAKDYLEKALKISTKNPLASLLLGVIYAEDGEFAKAKKLLEKVSAKKGNSVCANFALGMIYAAETDWTNSLNNFRQASEAKESAETNYLTGCVYFQLKRYKLAAGFFEKALGISVHYADARFMLSVVCEHLGERKKAAQMREEALGLKDNGAQFVEFIKRETAKDLEIALPFRHLQISKNRPLTGGARRLAKFFRESLFETLK